MRRHVVLFVLLLPVAALLDLGVAWLLALASEEFHQTMTVDPAWTMRQRTVEAGWEFAVQSRFGVVRAVATHDDEEYPAFDVPAGALPSWSSIHALEALSALDAGDAQYRAQMGGRIVDVYEDWAYGWPCVSWWDEYTGANGRWPGTTSVAIGKHHFPVRPVWTGRSTRECSSSRSAHRSACAPERGFARDCVHAAATRSETRSRAASVGRRFARRGWTPEILPRMRFASGGGGPSRSDGGGGA